MKPRRLLVLTYHFSPDGAVGGLRWSALAKYLARAGWDVHVVTAARQSDNSKIPGLQVHYVVPRDTMDAKYKRWNSRRALGKADAAHSGTHVVPDGAPAETLTLFEKLRRIAGDSLYAPDYARGWLLRAAMRARALNQTHEFGFLISSGPPHSVHLAGKLVTAGTPTKRIVDMRDPWVPFAGFRPPAASLTYASLPVFERSSIAGTDAVIANTSSLQTSLQARYPLANVEWLPNGVDLERLPTNCIEKFPGLSLAYAGTLYLHRNLSSVLRAMHGLFTAHPELREKCVLRVAGNMDGPHAASFLGQVRSLGLEDRVVTMGSVSSTDALALVSRSHLALVLAQSQPVQVPAKLYECVGLNIPTLVLAEGTSAAASEARRIGAFTCEPDAVEDIQRHLELLLAGRIALSTNTSLFSYEALAAKLRALLEGLEKC